MGDVSAEPSMEDILSSIKRIIAEEGDAATAPQRPRRPVRPPVVERLQPTRDEEVLELSERLSVEEPGEDEQVLPAETILSSRAAEASRGSLETLSKLVKPEAPGGDSFEGVVREMIRPMLREWLDAHLPAMVETMVAREISRITGSAG